MKLKSSILSFELKENNPFLKKKKTIEGFLKKLFSKPQIKKNGNFEKILNFQVGHIFKRLNYRLKKL